MTLRIHRLALPAVLAVLAATAAMHLPAPARAQEPIVPGNFQAQITNPLFPISLTGPKLFEGTDTDPDTGAKTKTRLESKVLPQTRVIMGVTVTVLEERAYDDGELVELALDFFAQHRDGSVYYFGEEVSNYEDGKLKNHNGQWLAGDGENRPGIVMPAQPKLGETFVNEHAPGVAEDAAEVLSLNEAVTTPAGSYTGCLKTRDFTPLEPGVNEYKWYCPNIGLVREQGDDSVNELKSGSPAPQPAATATMPAAPTPAPTKPAGIVAPNTGDGWAIETDDAGSAVLMLAVGVVLGGIGATIFARSRTQRRE